MKIFVFTILAAIFAFLQNAVLKFEIPYPRVKTFKNSVVGDAGYLSLGLRRLGADLGFIGMMQYYGTPEKETLHIDTKSLKNKKITREDIEMSEYHIYGIAPRVHSEIEGGNYPEIIERAKYILTLDPYFNYPILFAAGVLAFNLNRPGQALEILNLARKYQPFYRDYNLYIAAIGHKSKDPAQAARILDEAIKTPDTPVMIKNITAFLYKQTGNYARAYEIYLDIYQNSEDEKYAKMAEKQLLELKAYLKK